VHNDDEVLRQLDALVCEIVGHPVDPDENYFTAGLDSLSVTKLHTLLTRRLGVTLPVMALFRRPTLRATATAVVARRAADEAALRKKQQEDAQPVAPEPQATTPAPRTGAPTRDGGAAASRREIRERIRRGQGPR
jgi:aryl carrier-like protein